MKLEIKVMIPSKTKGNLVAFTIKGEITDSGLNEHDLSAHLFAIEFACNNHSEIPMRVHILTN